MHVACVHAWASLSECALSVFKYTQSTPHTIMGLHICLFSRIGLIFPSFILKPIKFPPPPPTPTKNCTPYHRPVVSPHFSGRQLSRQGAGVKVPIRQTSLMLPNIPQHIYSSTMKYYHK